MVNRYFTIKSNVMLKKILTVGALLLSLAFYYGERVYALEINPAITITQ